MKLQNLTRNKFSYFVKAPGPKITFKSDTSPYVSTYMVYKFNLKIPLTIESNVYTTIQNWKSHIGVWLGVGLTRISHLYKGFGGWYI